MAYAIYKRTLGKTKWYRITRKFHTQDQALLVYTQIALLYNNITDNSRIILEIRPASTIDKRDLYVIIALAAFLLFLAGILSLFY